MALRDKKIEKVICDLVPGNIYIFPDVVGRADLATCYNGLWLYYYKLKSGVYKLLVSNTGKLIDKYFYSASNGLAHRTKPKVSASEFAVNFECLCELDDVCVVLDALGEPDKRFLGVNRWVWEYNIEGLGFFHLYFDLDEGLLLSKVCGV